MIKKKNGLCVIEEIVWCIMKKKKIINEGEWTSREKSSFWKKKKKPKKTIKQNKQKNGDGCVRSFSWNQSLLPKNNDWLKWIEFNQHPNSS